VGWAQPTSTVVVVVVATAEDSDRDGVEAA